jgi:glycosyltransferase involved in cell wall biosynthesis
MSIILTIGIPTYNGSKTILTLLNSISSQNFDKSKVEILISNNASSDNTSNVIETFIKENDQLTIKTLTNKINLGFDGNISKLINFASGQYLWLIGDDDYLIENSIKKLLDFLNENNTLDYIYTNFFIYSKSKKLKPFSSFQHNISSNKINKLFKTIGLDNNFLSSNVFKLELIKSLNHSIYLNSGWMHYSLFLDSLTVNFTFYLFSSPLIVNNGTVRSNNSDSASKDGKWLYIYITLIDLLNKNEFSNFNKRYFVSKLLYGLPFKINNSIRNGYVLKKEHLLFFNNYFKYSFFYWFFIFPLFFLNKRIHVILYKILKGS